MVFGDAVDLNTELAMREKIERLATAFFAAVVIVLATLIITEIVKMLL